MTLRTGNPLGPAGALSVGVSTKMYLGYQASLRWLAEVRSVVDARPGLREHSPGENTTVRVFVMPSFPVLEQARRIFDGSPVVLGAQNCSWGDGPLTGEVSPSMLAELGVSLVEVGHAERRRLFGETGPVIARKVHAAVDAGLAPLLCIGEPDPRDPEYAAEFCLGQIKSAVGSDHSLLSSVALAYEPVWAIGADAPAGARYVNAVAGFLRDALGDASPIIYGGSAGPGLLPALPRVDGLFLGRFAHDAANLGRVLDEALQRAATETVS